MGYRVHRLHSLVHLLHQTGSRVYRPILATQPYTLASTTSYRVYRPVPATQPYTLASTTGYRVYRPVPATQPCTLTSTTGYSVPAGTGYTALYTCFINWLHMASTYRLQVYRQGTGYTVLTVLFFTQLVT